MFLHSSDKYTRSELRTLSPSSLTLTWYNFIFLGSQRCNGWQLSITYKKVLLNFRSTINIFLRALLILLLTWTLNVNNLKKPKYLNSSSRVTVLMGQLNFICCNLFFCILSVIIESKVNGNVIAVN